MATATVGNTMAFTIKTRITGALDASDLKNVSFGISCFDGRTLKRDLSHKLVRIVGQEVNIHCSGATHGHRNRQCGNNDGELHVAQDSDCEGALISEYV
jgi:hypothetical protein